MFPAECTLHLLLRQPFRTPPPWDSCHAREQEHLQHTCPRRTCLTTFWLYWRYKAGTPSLEEWQSTPERTRYQWRPGLLRLLRQEVALKWRRRRRLTGQALWQHYTHHRRDASAVAVCLWRDLPEACRAAFNRLAEATHRAWVHEWHAWPLELQRLCLPLLLHHQNKLSSQQRKALKLPRPPPSLSTPEALQAWCRQATLSPQRGTGDAASQVERAVPPAVIKI